MATDRSNDGLLRIVLVVLAVLVLFPVLMMVLVMPMMGMMGVGWTGAWGASPLWAVGMMVVWLLVLLGIGYALYRGLSGHPAVTPNDPALEELRIAYARGELTDEEFETRRETLQTEE